MSGEIRRTVVRRLVVQPSENVILFPSPSRQGLLYRVPRGMPLEVERQVMVPQARTAERIVEVPQDQTDETVVTEPRVSVQEVGAPVPEALGQEVLKRVSVQRPVVGNATSEATGCAYRPGDIVVLNGLRNFGHLNGEIVKLQQFDRSKMHWSVELRSGLESVVGRLFITVKPENLVRSGTSKYMKGQFVHVWSGEAKAWQLDGIIVEDSAFDKTAQDGQRVMPGSVLVQYASNTKSKWIPPHRQQQLLATEAPRLHCAPCSRAIVDIIRNSRMAFLRVDAIKKLVWEGKPLPRKQDLCEAGVRFLAGEDAVHDWTEVTSEHPATRIFVTSHPWYGEEHPDNNNGDQLRSLQEELDYVRAADDDLVFHDFSSLPQKPRRTSEEKNNFEHGLRGMNELYTSDRAEVLLVPWVPESAANPIPYQKRGWCQFELSIAKEARRIVNQMRYTDLVENALRSETVVDKFNNGEFVFTDAGDKDKLKKMLQEVENKSHRREEGQTKSIGPSCFQ